MKKKMPNVFCRSSHEIFKLIFVLYLTIDFVLIRTEKCERIKGWLRVSSMCAAMNPEAILEQSEQDILGNDPRLDSLPFSNRNEDDNIENQFHITFFVGCNEKLSKKNRNCEEQQNT